MPATIGAVVSSGKATLKELQEFYGTQDLYDILEVIAIDAHNRQRMTEKQ